MARAKSAGDALDENFRVWVNENGHDFRVWTFLELRAVVRLLSDPESGLPFLLLLLRVQS